MNVVPSVMIPLASVFPPLGISVAILPSRRLDAAESLALLFDFLATQAKIHPLKPET